MRAYLRLLLLTSAGLLASCGGAGSDTPPPLFDGAPKREASVTATATAEPKMTAPETASSFAGFSQVFETKTETGNARIVIAPWGDVVAFGGAKAVLLARDTGRELLSFDVCFNTSSDTAAFVDDHRLLITCADRVDEITFPSGQVKTAFKFPKLARTETIGGGRVVTAGGVNFGPNDVNVYTANGFRLVDTFDPGAAVARLVVSPDGKKLAAETTRDGVIVRDVVAKTSRKLGSDPHAHALRFSPDGKALLMMVSGSESDEIDLTTGKPRSSFHTSSDISGAYYLDANDLLVAGSGLTVFSGATPGTPALQKGLGGALGVSADGSYFCNAEDPDSDKIVCFSKKPVAASTFVAPPPAIAAAGDAPADAPSPPAAGAPPAGEAKVETEGTLLSHLGKVVTVKLDDASGVTVGGKGELYKRFETNLGFGHVTGWMSIADVEVKAVGDHKVELTILKESADITMNGKHQDQFTAQTHIQLKLAR